MGLPPTVRLLPCGQCIGCRLERSRHWAARCLHHASLFKHNSFVTLTYDDEHLQSKSLNHQHFQKFIRALRKKSKQVLTLKKPDLRRALPPETRDGGAESQISYYMAGEYGPKNFRPHYHACLFNCAFPDQKYYRTTKTKSKIYTSDLLTNIWGKGFTSIGEVNYQSAAYIARYIINKQTGNDAWKYYQRVDEETGEITDLLPEYNRMSLKPAIGKNWFERYHTDVYPHGVLHVRGADQMPPKYYDKLFKALNLNQFEQMKKEREVLGREFQKDNSPQRLQAKERVKRAQLNQLLRTL